MGPRTAVVGLSSAEAEEAFLGDIKKLLEAAEKLTANGDEAGAKRQRELAARTALRAGDDGDPLLAAVALLVNCHSLLEERSWPTGSLPDLDEQLEEAIRLAGKSKQRNRELESQLHTTWSRALFAKPKKDAKVLDKAIAARHKAMELAIDAEVDKLSWKSDRIRAEATLAADGDELHLSLEELLGELATRLGEVENPREAREAVDCLFNMWAAQVEMTEMSVRRISLHFFLDKLAEVAERIQADNYVRAVAAACRSPCEGGVKGLNEVEQALLALIARDGSGSWESKAAELKDKSLQVTAESLEALWMELGPKVKKVTDADEEMNCGHSCSTCPTKSECHVHEALATDF